MGCNSSKEAPTAPTSSAKPTKEPVPEKKPDTPAPEKPEKGLEEEKEVSITDKYAFGKVLGSGCFSIVKQATNRQTGEQVAIKCISKNRIEKEELALLKREINIMKKLDHPHIIKFYEVINSKNNLYLVLEYLGGGELFEAICQRGNYAENEAAEILKQILEAVDYCHKQNIAHRDLKPENLLLSTKEPPFVKIADFGLSKEFSNDKLATACGTPDYVAPEVVMGDSDYGIEVDIWSIGVIAYILLCGVPPFQEPNQPELFDKIMNAEYDFPSPIWDDVSEEAKNFVRRILVVSAKERATATELLCDPWLLKMTDQDVTVEHKLDTVDRFAKYHEQYKKAVKGKEKLAESDFEEDE